MIIENINDLTISLNKHLREPQRSERWANYRLILPVLDFSNNEQRFSNYFEYTQINKDGKRLSVDIAIFQKSKLVLKVEAKRLGKTMSSDQMEKYLEMEERGIVTNGATWILRLKGKNKTLHLWQPKEKCISQNILMEILDFLQLKPCPTVDWSSVSISVNPLIRPEQLSVASTGTRKNNLRTTPKTLDELENKILGLDKISPNSLEFFKGVIKELRAHGLVPETLIFELSRERVAIFIKNEKEPKKRISRILFLTKIPSILIRTDIVERIPEIQQICAHHEHDKGRHMREFEPSVSDQAHNLGELFARYLVKF